MMPEKPKILLLWKNCLPPQGEEAKPGPPTPGRAGLHFQYLDGDLPEIRDFHTIEPV